MRQLVYSVPGFKFEYEDGKFYYVDKENEEYGGEEIDGGYVNKLLEKMQLMNFDEAQEYFENQRTSGKIVFIRRTKRRYERDSTPKRFSKKHMQTA